MIREKQCVNRVQEKNIHETKVVSIFIVVEMSLQSFNILFKIKVVSLDFWVVHVCCRNEEIASKRVSVICLIFNGSSLAGKGDSPLMLQLCRRWILLPLPSHRNASNAVLSPTFQGRI